MAYMPHERSRLVSNYGAKDTYNRDESYSNGGREMGYLNGYQDPRHHPVSYPEVLTKPHHTHTPDDSFVTKTTETIVEYIRVPMVTHNRPHEGDEFINKVQTEVSRPIKTTPIINLNWRQTANYNGYGESNNYGWPSDPGTNIYNKARVNGTHQHNFNGLHGKSEFVPEDRQDYRVNTTDGWARPSQVSMEIPSKHTKPTNDVEIAPEYLKEATVIAAPIRGRLPTPVVPRVEVLQPVIGSKEAAWKFGGTSIAPVELYTPTIDSKEAAWKYRGQEF